MQHVIKRILDVAVALAVGILSLPAMAVLAVAIRWDSPGPVFFRQTRIGLAGRPFSIVKFRTMRIGAEKEWQPPQNRDSLKTYYFQDAWDPRITRVGAWLRRTSLDELPNFWNVLRGEMAVVGPRPEVPEIVALYDARMQRRLRCKPGITGLAQVSGRGELSTLEAILCDLEYCESWSVWWDLQILLQTVGRVLRGSGAV